VLILISPQIVIKLLELLGLVTVYGFQFDQISRKYQKYSCMCFFKFGIPITILWLKEIFLSKLGTPFGG